MINNKKILAIIPARGGSKRLPGKNIRNLGGIPLIAWTIKAAQQSKYLDKFILSTDDKVIAATAETWHCDVPFLRPAELASDTADSCSVVKHAIDHIDFDVDIIVLLQPTSPFRSAEHIDAALEMYIENQSTSLVSVTLLNKDLEWLFFIDDKTNRLQKIYEKNLFLKQKLSHKAYYLNGAIYIVDKNYFISHHKVIHDATTSYVMENDVSLDIDTNEDFLKAELLIKETGWLRPAHQPEKLIEAAK